MYLSIVCWSLWVLIGTFDARENRIPNQLVLLLIIASLTQHWAQTHDLGNVLAAAGCGAVVFAGALVLHLLKMMAPGDVKLMAAFGCFVGWVSIGSALYWVCVATVIVGCFYWVQKQVFNLTQQQSDVSLAQHVIGSAVVSASLKGLNKKKALMPFAPVVVIGLALHNYFI